MRLLRDLLFVLVGSRLSGTDAPIVLPNNAIARRFRVISTSAFNATVNVTCEP